MSSDPFESDEHEYSVLANELGQHSLWPQFLDVPSGWATVFGPAARVDCLAHIEKNWTDILPVRSA